MTEQDRETLKDDASELRCIAKSEFNELEHGTRLWMGELASRLEALASHKPPEGTVIALLEVDVAGGEKPSDASLANLSLMIEECPPTARLKLRVTQYWPAKPAPPEVLDAE